MYNLIELFIIGFSFLYASYTDLKQAIVPDNFTYGLIISGLIWSLATSNFTGIGFAATIFIIGFIVNHIGQFGGGDVKFLTGLALWNPAYLSTFEFYLIMFVVSGITALLFIGIIKLYQAYSNKIIIIDGMIKFIPFLLIGYIGAAVAFL